MTTDIGAGVEGQIRFIIIGIKGDVMYNFQPKGLHPKKQAPIDRYAAPPGRFPEDMEKDTHHLPMEILGTDGKDDLSGFSGKISHFILHPNGCLHVGIQPQGNSPEDGDKYEAREFAFAEVSGPVIDEFKKMPKEVAASGAGAASPAGNAILI